MGKALRVTRESLPWFPDSRVLAAPVGVAAVVTCHDVGQDVVQVGLWAIGLREPMGRAGLLDVGVVASLSDATKAEIAALIPRLSEWLPALWHPSLPSINDIVCVPIDAVDPAHPNSTVTWRSVVQGPSLQAAALLAVASWLAKHPLPPDFVVSAEVNWKTGDLVRVERLTQKREGLSLLAPKLSRLVGFGEGAELPTFSSLLEQVGIQRALLAWGTDSPERAIVALEEIAAAGSTALPSFTAVSQAATALLERGLTLEQGVRVRFAQAIVDRHDNRSANMPDWEELAAARGLTPPLSAAWIEQLAQVVQHHTDRGEKLPPAVSRLAEGLVADVDRADTPCWPASIKLQGALGRNASVRWTDDSLREAFVIQIHACNAWIRHRLFAEMSYPLSEAFRLAGALGDVSAFEQVDALRTDWEARAQARTASSGVYVDLAAGRARTLLHESAVLIDDGRIFELLAPIATRKTAAREEMVFASQRWLRRTHEGIDTNLGKGEQHALAMLDDVVRGRASTDETPTLLRRLREVAPWASLLPETMDLRRLTRGSPY